MATMSSKQRLYLPVLHQQAHALVEDPTQHAAESQQHLKMLRTAIYRTFQSHSVWRLVSCSALEVVRHELPGP